MEEEEEEKKPKGFFWEGEWMVLRLAHAEDNAHTTFGATIPLALPTTLQPHDKEHADMGSEAAVSADMAPLFQHIRARTDSSRSSGSDEDRYYRIDAALAEAINHDGWPEWFTPGRGNLEPNRRRHSFKHHSFNHSARIDFFYRGKAEDDWQNVDWAILLGHLPRYRALLDCEYMGTKTMGDAMEMAVGIAYACYTEQRYLPSSHSLVFNTDTAMALWARIWPLLMALDIRATIG